MRLVARDRVIEFPRRPMLMGIVNLNDDSFCGDGTLDVEQALVQAEQMVRNGADIIDIGGESARTNREAVTEEEEIRRVQPFVEQFEARMEKIKARDGEQCWPPLLSINTWRPRVAEALLKAGGHILNDIGGLPTPANARICAEQGVSLLIMHSVGEPKQPHTHVRYEAILEELDRFFTEKIEKALGAGLSFESILLDPGIDFAKQSDDNLSILTFGNVLMKHERPILWPISRKTVIKDVLGIERATDRDPATISCLVQAVSNGASVLRVHQVSAAYSAVCILSALRV